MVFALQANAIGLVRECDTLRDESLGTRCERGIKQVFCSLASQAICITQLGLDQPRVDSFGQCRQLMNDNLGFCILDGLHEIVPLKHIADDDLSTLLSQVSRPQSMHEYL